MDIKFDGQCVVVTGAGGGIGRAIAILFAEHDANVVVNDINKESANETVKLIKDSKKIAIPFVTDVTDDTKIEDLVNFACNEFNSLDVMVNNAGGALPAPLHTVTPENYRRTMALNLDSVFYGSISALKVMRGQGKGCILSITSGAGMAAEPNLAVYGAAKAAIINLMRSIAIEYGHEGIRANAVSPGPMDTPGLRLWLDTLPGGAVEYESKLPSGRLGTGEDVAQAAVFLASDQASYINGTLLPVDGAIHAKLATPS